MNGKFIRELQLPLWNDTKKLVAQTYREIFSKKLFIDWDVALTSDGVQLIEENNQAGCGLYEPLGHFPEIKFLIDKIKEDYNHN